jgi:hypothetical protein
MPIDLAQVDWIYVAVLAILAFVASIIGNLLSLNHKGAAAVLTALAFAVLFVAWTYYPHHLPLPTRLNGGEATVTAPASAPTTAPAPATPSAPATPRNPVTDVTPPAR